MLATTRVIQLNLTQFLRPGVSLIRKLKSTRAEERSHNLHLNLQTFHWL